MACSSGSSGEMQSRSIEPIVSLPIKKAANIAKQVSHLPNNHLHKGYRADNYTDYMILCP